MKLIVLHYHLRPGGVRRVIEVAAPHLLAHWRQPVSTVVLATGEAPDPGWLTAFRRRLPGTRVKVLVEPAFGYVAELPAEARSIRHRVRDGLAVLLNETVEDDCLIWAHNLGLGRNLPLAHELARASRFGGPPIVAHHHDWWFENRWQHFAVRRDPGFRTLDAVADAVLPALPGIWHAGISHADAAVLEAHFPGRAGWLPNPVEQTAPPPAARVEAARAWLSGQLGEAAPVWLLPCRLLRRKNIAEALLLTRWLRPEAWLVTTGGPSSAEEQAYAEGLTAAARAHGWRLRLGILGGDESRKPSVPELLAASEAVLLTSLQEGFGLPFLEASAAGRPLVARELPNIAPDLAEFGFKFPQSYREILVHPSLFDWRGERQRQTRRFAEWKDLMPRAASRLAGRPALLAAGSQPGPVPFSRLTLTAQLEVLAQPVRQSWEQCRPLNPLLDNWRERAAAGRLQATPWPRSAEHWLGGAAYAQRFQELVSGRGSRTPGVGASQAALSQFLRQKLSPQNVYPLLWNPRP